MTFRDAGRLRGMATCLAVALLLAACVADGGPDPMPSPDAAPEAAPSPPPPPDPCDGEGWTEATSVARGAGAIRSVAAVGTRSDGSLTDRLDDAEILHIRVESDPDLGAPSVLFDLDGQRDSGGWTFGSTVSSAGWDLRIAEGGEVGRHTGPSTGWDWDELEPPAGFRWRSQDGTTTVCLPVSVLGDAHRVGIGVKLGDQWLPDPFLPSPRYPAAGPRVAPHPVTAGPVRIPERLAIAYSYRPWLVRGCGDDPRPAMACAAEAYAHFRHVILAAGLENPEHASHDGTVELIARLRADHPEQEIWGYVSLRRYADTEHTTEDIRAKAQQWQAIGATGIFLDEVDLCERDSPGCTATGVTRADQRGAVEAIHGLGMPVFANAFSVVEALGVLNGEASPLGRGTPDRASDMYLLENPTYVGGEWRQGVELHASNARIEAAIRLTHETGVRLAAVDTADRAVSDDGEAEPGYVAGWWRAVQAGAEAYGFTNTFYSATDEDETNLAVLDPPADAEQLEGRYYADRSLRLSDGGMRISRDLADCRGAPAGAIVADVSGVKAAMRVRLIVDDPVEAC